MVSKLPDGVTSIIQCTDGTWLGKVSAGTLSLIASPTTSTAWTEECLSSICAVTGLDAVEVDARPHRWFKLHLPNQTYVINAVFCALFSVEQKNMCQLAAGFTWWSPKDANLRRCFTHPVCLDFLTKAIPIDYNNYAPEFHTIGNLIEVSPYTLILSSAISLETTSNNWDIMGLQEALFVDFYTTCQPSILMSLHHFVEILNKFGVTGAWLEDLFWAVDMKNVGFISYSEFACLMICVNPFIKQDDHINDMRKLYLFRMFDRDHDSILSKSELEALLLYVREETDPDVASCLEKPTNIHKFMNIILCELKYVRFHNMLNVQSDGKLPYSDFSEKIDTIFENSLTLCLRMNINFLEIYRESVENTKMAYNEVEVESIDFTTGYHRYLQDRKEFEIIPQLIHMSEIDYELNAEDIWSLKDVLSKQTLLHSYLVKGRSPMLSELNSPKLIYNNLLNQLRYLTNLNFPKHECGTFDWGLINATGFGKLLLKLCAITKKVVMKEPRRLIIQSPIYIIGALNGSFEDLYRFERVLWPRTMLNTLGTVLFLGSYVEGAPFGIEIITYLFCYKNLIPMKVFLLRGSHDNRWYQTKAGFKRECLLKFGPDLGKQVWEAINSVFDSLPVSATIDDKILCVHSGIPQPAVCAITNIIDKLPLSIENPYKESHLLTELTWNQPINTDEDPTVKFERSDGFLQNTQTGIGYFFNGTALFNFLETNYYSHLIRTSNSAVTDGFSFSESGRLLTVYSCSNHDDCMKVACVIIESEKVRVIRIERQTPGKSIHIV